MLTLCGCVYLRNNTAQYLPQISFDAHTSIVGNASSTTLTQLFVNPSANPIPELRYVFPLYDGVSVVGFQCHVGDRTLNGVVKERTQAKKVYDEATARGETAALLAQSHEASDVFTTMLGNIGPSETVKVVIKFIGELKHDAEVDGVRFTLPTSISPRYGSSPSLDGTAFEKKGISFTLDAEVPEGSAITAIQSPSHPIRVNVGALSTAPAAEPSLRKASATLSLESAALDKDIVIQVVASNGGNPSAVVEHHPTLDSQALMVTLVPKFNLPSEKPEIVFVCDRSGSMSGSIGDLKEALRIFLKSLPVGVKFNICSFGSSYSFLWKRSQIYDQRSLAEASAHIEMFQADYGGTEMYNPVNETFKQRFKDVNLEVFLLTDGEIWDQAKLFQLVDDNVRKSNGAIRVFTLGVGIGASSSLIEGVARAGNGFAQTTAAGEKMDKKVVRMLKGALFPHIRDYTLEVQYQKDEASDDDFELVEKISDSLVISESAASEEGKAAPPPYPESMRSSSNDKRSPVKRIISLFQKDLTDDVRKTDDTAKFDNADKFAGLPTISVPIYLQTPSQIPTLFPFNRTTVYVIINNRSSIPKSVLLKGTSQHGALELEIAVTPLATDGIAIHQLAARREMKELEEGRGWLSLAKTNSGKSLKTKHDSHFSDMVEREAVRLGITYQIAGRWTSFVAVQKKANGDKSDNDPKDVLLDDHESIVLAQEKHMRLSLPMQLPQQASQMRMGRMSHSPQPCAPAPAWQALPVAASYAGGPPDGMAEQQHMDNLQLDYALGKGRTKSSSLKKGGAPVAIGAAINSVLERGYSMKPGFSPPSASFGPIPPPPPARRALSPSTSLQLPADPLQQLTILQSFSGSWSWSQELKDVLGLGPEVVAKLSVSAQATANGGDNDVFATACAIAYFKKRLGSDKDSWEMMVEKAEDWLAGEVEKVLELLGAVEGLF